jgi:hypothetical protein
MFHIRHILDSYRSWCLAILLLGIVSEQAVIGEETESASRNGAIAWLDKARASADQIADQQVRSQANYEMTYVLSRAGRFDDALGSASQVQGSPKRTYAYAAIAKRAHETGDQAHCLAALKEARQVALADSRGQSNGHLIRLYFEVERPQDAESFVDALSNPTQQRIGFREIAKEYASCGNLQAGFRVVQTCLQHPARQLAYVNMATASADAGDLENAKLVLEKLDDVKLRDGPLAAMVRYLVKENKFEEASSLAAQISDPQKRAQSQALVVANSSPDKDQAVLQKEMSQASSREAKIAIGNSLIARLVAASELKQAEEIVQRLSDYVGQNPRPAQPSKFGTRNDAVALAEIRINYLSIARQYDKQGQRQECDRLLEAAADAVVKLPEEAGVSKWMLLNRLVHAQLQLGAFEEVEQAIKQIPNDYVRSAAAARLAAGLIRSGDVAAGMRVSDMVTAKLGRGDAIGDIVAALLQKDEFARARKILSGIGDSTEEVRAFRRYGQEMVALGYGERLRGELQDLPSHAARTYACIGAAEPNR